MLMLISPAKTLDYAHPAALAEYSQPSFTAHSAELIAVLKQKSPQQIAELMGISDKLAVLNYERFQSWSTTFTLDNAKQALYAFMGDVYEGLDAQQLNYEQVRYLDQHLRILSGLYGLLKPLDLMQPYRLEMGTALTNPRGKDLYAFWGNILTDSLNQLQPDVIVNLASNEYFKSIKTKSLSCPVITPVFEDWSSGKYKIVSFYAKRARGLMVRWAALNSVTEVEQLKEFNLEGYCFDAEASEPHIWRMRRKNTI